MEDCQQLYQNKEYGESPIFTQWFQDEENEMNSKKIILTGQQIYGNSILIKLFLMRGV